MLNLMVSTSFLIALFTGIAPSIGDLAVLRYEVQDRSELNITGTSNVNSFCCTSHESFEEGNLTYEIRRSDRIEISSGEFHLTTSKMDCGNKQITKDFLAALRSDEFPRIRIDLNALILDGEDTSAGGWQKAVADTDIVIAGCTNHKYLDVQFRMLENRQLEAQSSTKLCISDFGIEPPKALFGLIKVDDEVVINMHLFIDYAG